MLLDIRGGCDAAIAGTRAVYRAALVTAERGFFPLSLRSGGNPIAATAPGIYHNVCIILCGLIGRIPPPPPPQPLPGDLGFLVGSRRLWTIGGGKVFLRKFSYTVHIIII